MRYALMFVNTLEEIEQWERTPTPEQKDVYNRIFRWFQDHTRDGTIVNSGAELQPPHTATTVRFKGSNPVVTDGPFMEAKEIVGGFSIIDVPDLDAAIAFAKTWPGRSIVEIRPVVDHSKVE